MMNIIVNEKEMRFKEIEQKIYDYMCEQARVITQELLGSVDEILASERDKKIYRDKGYRKTSIKTVYGLVEYRRHVYEYLGDEEQKAYIFLLDQALQMNKIGLISTNYAQKLVESVTKLSYRATSESISSTTGQVLSHGGVWNLIQRLGEKISQEEKTLVKKLENDQLKGEEETPILFEEMDGVHLYMQGKDRPMKGKKRELKVSLAYKGWKKDGKGNSTLLGKVMTAGFEAPKEFHKKREAMICQKYNADEIKARILNGDGAAWIKTTYDPETIFQLDPYHIQQKIIRSIKHKEHQKEIRKLLTEHKTKECFDYITMYGDSVATDDQGDKSSEKAYELLSYLENNEEGIIPYRQRGLDLPDEPEGIVYKGLGTQENHNCSVITMRMKHRRASWTKAGAANMANILVRKENKTLYKTVERYTEGIIAEEYNPQLLEILSAAKAPTHDGKGNQEGNIKKGHVMYREAMMTESRKSFLRRFDMRPMWEITYR
jgi:hypothetical protein